MPTLLVIADPAAKHLRHLERLPPDTHVIVSNDEQQLRERAAEADVILNIGAKGDRLGSCLETAKRVKWMHSLFTGVEGVLTPAVVASPIPLTNGRGAFRMPLGEWTVAAMLHFAYDLRRDIRQQEAGVWEAFSSRSIAGSTLGIIGYGGIGSAAAERAKPFGVKIAALRRRPELFAGDQLVDAFYSPAQLEELISASDYLLLAAPLTPETRGMIGAKQIAAMKPKAVLINVGRGAVVDEAALAAALEAGKIGGAALDVYVVEPLPAGHPFYRLKNVLLSPHCADHIEDFFELAYNVFLENWKRFEAGEPLTDLVDKHAGY